VNAISGLGFTYTASGLKASCRRFLVLYAYRKILDARSVHVIFQNSDDQELFVRKGITSARQAHLIRGAGVDLSYYRPMPESDGVPVVILCARMLRDKGVYEFAEAARLIAQRSIPARFALVGACDPHNPSGLLEGEINHLTHTAPVEWWGHQRDMRAVYAASHMVCLPSYREGLPKVLLEAAASGRPVVTSDVPGCREAIEAGVTGLLVPVRDSSALADALSMLLRDPVMRKQMGVAGRARAERLFGEEVVQQLTLDLYKYLLAA
jgi:glycosyltransferase involved in cell wall biosynthesis